MQVFLGVMLAIILVYGGYWLVVNFNISSINSLSKFFMSNSGTIILSIFIFQLLVFSIMIIKKIILAMSYKDKGIDEYYKSNIVHNIIHFGVICVIDVGVFALSKIFRI